MDSLPTHPTILPNTPSRNNLIGSSEGKSSLNPRKFSFWSRTDPQFKRASRPVITATLMNHHKYGPAYQTILANINFQSQKKKTGITFLVFICFTHPNFSCNKASNLWKFVITQAQRHCGEKMNFEKCFFHGQFTSTKEKRQLQYKVKVGRSDSHDQDSLSSFCIEVSNEKK